MEVDGLLSSFAARHVCLSVAIILCPLRAHAYLRVCVCVGSLQQQLLLLLWRTCGAFSSLRAFTAAKSPEDELQDLTA